LAFSYWIDKPWFLLRKKLLLCSSYLPLGVPNWSVIYINTVRINLLQNKFVGVQPFIAANKTKENLKQK
jgi:hypothetical protein